MKQRSLFEALKPAPPQPTEPPRALYLGGPFHEQTFRVEDPPPLEMSFEDVTGKCVYRRVTQLRDGIWLYSWRP